MSYPGQEYWHAMNPNIRRAEENWEERRAMNPQPVSLADELRKLAEDLRSYKPMRSTAINETQHNIANKLLALLAQHAVAEPKRQCWYSDNVVCPYSNQRDDKPAVLTPAHAAEQPKLTADQVREISEASAELQHFAAQVTEVTPPLTVHLEAIQIAMERVVDKLNALLTSPVAPPPHNTIKCLRDLSEVWQSTTGDSPAEKCMRSCGATLEDVLDMHQPPVAPREQPDHLLQAQEDYISNASNMENTPGEQPPQACPSCERDYATLCTKCHNCSDCCGCLLTPHLHAPAPPTQERASDFDKWWTRQFNPANPATGIQPYFLAKAAWATAAKQAREESLEEAAKICDNESEGYGEPGWVQASANCAEAIRKRALAAQPSPQTKG